MWKLMLVAAVSTLLAGIAGAGTVGVAARAGTLGFGAEVTLPLVESKLNVRAGYNTARLGVDVNAAEADGHATVIWQSIPVLLDWHPAGGPFRISGGPVINKNRVNLRATPNESIGLNGGDYDIVSADGSITFKSLAWYLGIGSGNAVSDGRVHFVFDLGVLYHGRPELEARATASNPALQDVINSELQVEVDKYEQDIRSFVVYPVISIGVAFTF